MSLVDISAFSFKRLGPGRLRPGDRPFCIGGGFASSCHFSALGVVYLAFLSSAVWPYPFCCSPEGLVSDVILTDPESAYPPYRRVSLSGIQALGFLGIYYRKRS